MKDVLDLFILDSSGTCLIRQKFKQDEREVDENLFTSFFMALQQFFDEMVMDESQRGNIKLLDRGNFKLLIEFDNATEIFAILIAPEDDYELRAKLQGLLKEFIDIYEEEIRAFKGKTDVFSDFRSFIRAKFPTELISEDHVPIIKDDELFNKFTDSANLNQKININGATIKWINKYYKVCKEVDGKKTIFSIAHSIGYTLIEVIEIISLLINFKSISLMLYPEIKDEDVFQVAKDSVTRIFSPGSLERDLIDNKFGKLGFQLILLCDGRRTVYEIGKLSQLPLEIVKHYVQQFVADEYIVRRRTVSEKKREKINLEEIKENKLSFYSSLLKNQQYSSLNFEILLSTMESAGIEAGLLISSSEDRIKKVDLKNHDSIFGVIIRILSYVHEHVYMSENVDNNGTITIDGCFECAFAKKIPRKKICTFTNGLIKGVIKYIELVTNEMIYNKVNVIEKTCYANKDPYCSWVVTLNF